VEAREYERLAAVEGEMWWFRGLHANLVAALRRSFGGERAAILDSGCGTGGLLVALGGALPQAMLFGLDLDEGAAATARAKSGRPVCVASIDRLPFADGAFDAVMSADVLCHEGVDEGAALAGLRRCLRPGGTLILNLPAYPWLFSAHDVAVANARRYARGELCRLLAHAGFTSIHAVYWNSFLFPLMLLRRKVWRGGQPAGGSEVALLPAPLERVFGAVMALENRLLKAGIGLPFGGSILATAVRP